MGRGLKGVEDGSRPRRARLGSSQGEPPRKADVALPRPPQVLAEARLPPTPPPVCRWARCLPRPQLWGQSAGLLKVPGAWPPLGSARVPRVCWVTDACGHVGSGVRFGEGIGVRDPHSAHVGACSLLRAEGGAGIQGPAWVVLAGSIRCSRS